MVNQGPPDLEALLAHDPMLRRLAVRLAGESDADDAVQETWLAALRRGTGLRAATAKAWLFVVLTRLVGSRARARESARLRDTAAAARRVAAPSTLEIVERESLRREVVEALLDLDPMYRDPILLRFEADLPPRKIGAALGIPTETARTRIKRGLALLRERLDQRVGAERRRAFVLLLPPAALRLPRAIAAGALAAAAVVTVVLVRAALPGLRERPEPAAPGTKIADAGAAPARAPAAAIRTMPFSEAVARVLEEREAGDVYPCAEPRDASGLHAIVVTRLIDELTGAPVPGATLSLTDEASAPGAAPRILRSAEADADGWVRLRVDDLRDRTLGTHWSAAGFAPGASSGAVPPFPIRLRGSAAVRVRAIDVRGNPVAGVAFDALVGAARWRAGSGAVSGEDGIARLAGIDPGTTLLRASHAGYATSEAPMGSSDGLGFGRVADVTLLRARVVSGVVLRRGVPVEGARVGPWRHATGSVLTDRAGRFVLPEVRAWDYLAVSVPEGPNGRWSEPVRLPDPPPGVSCALELDADFGEEEKRAAFIGSVSLCLVGEGGFVERVSDEEPLSLVLLRPGIWEIGTDDLAAPCEVVRRRMVVEPGDAPLDVDVDVRWRPQLLVEVEGGVGSGARIVLATDDASRDITEDVRADRFIPIPLTGTVIAAFSTGDHREAVELPAARSPRDPWASVDAPIRVRFAAPPHAGGVAAMRVVEVRDGSGSPVAGASVILEGDGAIVGATTDENGAAAFAVANERGRMAVRREGFATLYRVADAPATTTTIAWPDSLIAIEITGPDRDATPAAVVIVDGEPVPVERNLAFVRGLAPGEHRVIVARTGSVAKVVRLEVLGPGEEKVGIALRSEAGARR